MTPTEAMLTLMSLPLSHFDGVCRTSDGCYLAKAKGDVGYNHFLGKPSKPHAGPGRELMLKTWNSLTVVERAAVLTLAARPMDGVAIPLHEDFGVPKT